MWLSDWTELALGWPREQLIGCNSSVKLRDPGENPRQINDEMWTAFWKEARAHPGQVYTFHDSYIRHADGHHIELPTVTFYWDKLRAQYVIDMEVTEAEIARVRNLFPSQFANAFERAHIGNWLHSRRAAMSAPPALHEMRKWNNPNEMIECLALVASECSDVWDPRIFTVKYVCEHLSAIPNKPKISENTLTNRFKRWGWLTNGSLKETLVHMAVEMTADSRLY